MCLVFSQLCRASLIPSSILFIQINAQLECSKRMLKLTLKFTLKVLPHVSVYNHHRGAYYMCFAKVIFEYINNYNFMLLLGAEFVVSQFAIQKLKD
jgi:hypothetical protein